MSSLVSRAFSPRRLTAVLALALAVGVGGFGWNNGRFRSTNANAATKKCTAASLRGAYGVRFEGASKALGRFVSVSIWTFDGAGGFAASETYNSENTGPKVRSLSGEYDMRGDCQFGLLFPSDLAKQHDADGVCVLVDAQREFSCIDNEEGWQTLGVGKRIA